MMPWLFCQAKIVSVWDMTQCSLSRLSKAQVQMLQQTMHVVGAHYPERNEKLFIVNAPWWVFVGTLFFFSCKHRLLLVLLTVYFTFSEGHVRCCVQKLRLFSSVGASSAHMHWCKASCV
jgi:hypothetical protein